MKQFFSLLFACVVSASVAQNAKPKTESPKLVVGIVVDQMRQEYLYRFGGQFSNGGFRRLMNDGFMLKNGLA